MNAVQLAAGNGTGLGILAIVVVIGLLAIGMGLAVARKMASKTGVQNPGRATAGVALVLIVLGIVALLFHNKG